MCGYELAIGPEVALIHEEAGIGLLDEPRSPGFRRPGGVDFPLQKKRELLWVGNRDNQDVPTLFPCFQVVRLQPRTQCNVLRVALLWRGDLLAVKILGLRNASGGP